MNCDDSERRPIEPSARALLRNVAAELHALKLEGERLEHAIGHALLSDNPSTKETFANLQGIDLIVQTLGELGDYVEGLSSLVDGKEFVDVGSLVSGVSLRKLAVSLLYGKPNSVDLSRGLSSGDVDLF